MYINSLETKFQENSKIPIPLAGESYYHRHQPVKFDVVIEVTPIQKHSATGKIFLTDKRLMFIAQEPSDDFKTFHVTFEDVATSIKSSSTSIFKKKSKKVFSARITLRDDTVFIISIRYKTKDLGDKRIFEDYYGMILKTKIRQP